jgi:cell division protein FtsB
MAGARTLSAGSRPAGGPARVRWDRLARMAMLFVLVVLVYLYISPVRSLISTIHQSAAQRAELAGLERTTAKLRAERSALQSPSTLETLARADGFVLPGEKEFVVFGLPSN